MFRALQPSEAPGSGAFGLSDECRPQKAVGSGSKLGLEGVMASLLYGSGLRLMECTRLRVKDMDFEQHQLIVRDGKGGKDRITMLPDRLVEPLKTHLEKVGVLRKKDLSEGFGAVYLPFALEKKYPNANREWGWQYVFPATHRSIAVSRSASLALYFAQRWAKFGLSSPVILYPVYSRPTDWHQ